MGFDVELATQLATKALGASTTGIKLDTGDVNAVAQYVMAAISIGLDFVPVIGPLLSSLVVLIGAAVFPLHSKDIWNALHERVEHLVDSKIAQYHLKTLEGRISGLESNMEAFTSVVNSYNKASASDKDRQREILRQHHIAFLAVVRSAVPDFQLDDYAVQALPMFAHVANIHLSLLADGIKHGIDWGYTKAFIDDTLRPEFKKLTASEAALEKKSRLFVRSSEHGGYELETLHQAIQDGEAAGWSPELLATWKEAFADMVAQPAALSRRANSDYPGYVKNIYLRGRGKVQANPNDYPAWSTQTGGEEAGKSAAVAQYDTTMVLSALNFAELWPYLTREVKASSEALKNVDREVFVGPIGRYADAVPWSATSPPPVTPRGDPITGIRVRAYDALDGIQLKFGNSWGRFWGSQTGGKEYVVNLQAHEVVDGVKLGAGQKLSQLLFHTNKTTYGPYGGGNYRSLDSANITGYGLTSLYITRWSGAIPPGCEGVFLGFRPLLFA
ncbi:Pesticidal crystal protein cry3Aa [Beauveria bassiana D1-5]|uniref:Pesticidal crystal protein cry3Aa n=1 Tax=Beauveria bassiana D1-5 TaxID=1245745 RepID=A0A0A2VSI3_BEABA|nr:Pesticidal crystal protein cry3Aa [Beauveria bassiana D1-5]